MKTTAISFCLISGLLVGTACGANPLTKSSNAAATPSFTMTSTTPELEAAGTRVTQAEQQLEVARKQLSAAKSLLKAAEADLKAARADRDALALRTQAEGLAEQAGMTPSNQSNLPTRSIAAATPKPVATTTNALNNVTPTTSGNVASKSLLSDDSATAAAPTPATGDSPVATTQPVDFNAQPLNVDETAPAPSLQLR